MTESGKDVLTLIKKMSKKYVPEWNLDEDNPDIGTAFALTIAKLMQENIDLYEKLFDKHYIAFLNCLGLSPLNQLSATGYAVFGLSLGAQSGEYVPEDIVLDNNQNDLQYTVDKPLYVTSAELSSVFCSYADCINKAFAPGMDEIMIFDTKNAVNLQEHAFYLYHEWGFKDIAENTEIKLDLGDSPLVASLADKEICKWTYSSVDFVNFKNVSWADKKIVFKMGEEDFLPCTINGRSGYFIKCSFSRNLEELTDITVKKTEICFSASEVKSVRLFNRDIELSDDIFRPFGNSLIPYDCFYIACDEAFLKKKATITIDMHITIKTCEPKGISTTEVEKIPVEIKQISIDYWNGIDFVTLKTKKIDGTEGKDIFKSLKQGDVYEKRSIVFNCPDDMTIAVINGLSSCWIRIRIIEITNVYRGLIINNVPEIKDLTVSYTCELRDDYRPGLMLQNNMLCKDIAKNCLSEGVKIFELLEYKKPNIFFGFDKPFGGSPIKILFDLETSTEQMPELVFYIFSGGDWSRMSISDETQNFRNTGIITLYSYKPPAKKLLFGEDRYWIRAEYERDIAPNDVLVKKIYMNATQITQQSPLKTEIININANETLVYHMKSTDISEIEVYYGDEIYKGYEINKKAGIITFDERTFQEIKSFSADFTIKYRSSMGAIGNCSENTVTKIAASMGFVQTVTNPLQVYGGRSVETDEEMIKRGSKGLRHRQRAVTSSDFESLAKEVVPHLLSCKCFAKDADGKDCLGRMTLVYLPDNYDGGNKNESDISQKIKAYLEDRTHPILKEHGRLVVMEAIYVRIDLYIKVKTNEINNFTKIKTGVSNAFKRFLNPVDGNFGHTGYEIGKMPSESTIKNFLYSLREYGLMSIEKIEYKTPDNYKPAFALPMPGEIDVQVVV